MVVKPGRRFGRASVTWTVFRQKYLQRGHRRETRWVGVSNTHMGKDRPSNGPVVAHSLQNGIVELNWSWDQECWVGWLVRHSVRGRLRCPAGRRVAYIVVGHCRALCREGRIQLKDGFSVEMSSKETEPGGSARRSQGGGGGVKSDRRRSGDARC